MSAASAPAKRKAPKDAPARPRGKKTPNYFGNPTVSSFAAANLSSISSDSTPASAVAPPQPSPIQPADAAAEEPTPAINIVPVAQLPFAPRETISSLVAKEKQAESEKVLSIYASFKSDLEAAKLPPASAPAAPSPKQS